MLKYAIKSTAGDYLSKGKNTYYETADMNLATMWDSAAKAKNVIKNAIRLSDRRKYKVVEIFKGDKESGEVLPTAACSISGSFEKVVAQYWDFIDECDRRMTYLSDSLSRVDREITDITHFIEFSTLSASAGYKAYRMLHDKRKERRSIKDELEAIRDIKSYRMEDFDAIQNFMAMDRKKKYKPRELPELFKQEAQ